MSANIAHQWRRNRRALFSNARRLRAATQLVVLSMLVVIVTLNSAPISAAREVALGVTAPSTFATTAWQQFVRAAKNLGPTTRPSIAVVAELESTTRPTALLSWSKQHHIAVSWRSGQHWVAMRGLLTRRVSFQCSVTPKTVPIVRHCVGARCGVSNARGSEVSSGILDRLKSYGFSVRYATDPGASI